jgi:hypothetical protein
MLIVKVRRSLPEPQLVELIGLDLEVVVAHLAHLQESGAQVP